MKKKILYFLKKIKLLITNPTTVIKSPVNLSCHIGDYVVIEENVSFFKYIKFIGDGTYICKNTRINFCSSIGKYCSIAQDVAIGVGSHPIDLISTSPLFYSKNRKLLNSTIYKEDKLNKNVIIGNDVWIGTRATILNGVSIGNGAIIAAGAVVTKDVDPYTIVGGVPAKEIRKRFSPELIERLQKNDISNLHYKIILKNINQINNVELFIDNYELSINNSKEIV